LNNFESFKNKVEAYGPGLYYFPAKMLLLEGQVIEKFLKFLVHEAFQKDNALDAQSAQYYLLRMPSGEIAKRINKTIANEVDLENKYSYRTLLFFYTYFDIDLFNKYLNIGLNSASNEIYLIACEFQPDGGEDI